MPRVADIVDPTFTLPDWMTPEEQEFLTGVTLDLVNMLKSTEQAMSRKFDAQLFDLEEGNACWSLLPAKVRTAIKRGKQ